MYTHIGICLMHYNMIYYTTIVYDTTLHHTTPHPGHLQEVQPHDRAARPSEVHK